MPDPDLEKKVGRWGVGGDLQNIFLGPAAINRVEGNIETFSTRVRSREKEYESEITVVVDEQIQSDDFFWYFIRWPDLRREFLGYSKQS